MIFTKCECKKKFKQDRILSENCDYVLAEVISLKKTRIEVCISLKVKEEH
jgi:hypothetical protein